MEGYYYTYILYREKDNQNYAGYTHDLNLRFEQHCKGNVPSTKHRRPLQLIYFEACLSEDALRREKYFKTHYGKMFLKNRLKFYFTGFLSNK
nr:GIY-YIG nuclease family protein [uncultured Draconibacterium sp.]